MTQISIYGLFSFLLGTTIALHDIVNAQGLTEHMEILNAILRESSGPKSAAQGTHKVLH